MSIEAALAAASFVGLFVAWVVVPSFVKERHNSKTKD